MDCQIVSETNKIDVAPGAEVFADLPQHGVLRLERKGAAMTGTPEIANEDGALALYFADGAAVYLKNA